MNNIKILFVGLLVLLAGCQQQMGGAAEGGAVQDEVESLSQLHIYKTPTCGCCAEWVTHMEDAGFPVTVENKSTLNDIKDSLNIPVPERSCHTAISEDGKYFFEGHIPAHLVKRFLKNPPPDALGLAVAGMPIGSPGMEVDDRFSPYSVMVVKKNGVTEEFARVDTQQSQYQP